MSQSGNRVVRPPPRAKFQPHGCLPFDGLGGIWPWRENLHHGQKQLRDNVTHSGQNGLALDLVRRTAEFVIAARRKPQFLGHRTLQSLVEEIARRLPAFKGIREWAMRRKQITPSIKP